MSVRCKGDASIELWLKRVCRIYFVTVNEAPRNENNSRSPNNANRLAAHACSEMEGEGLYGLRFRARFDLSACHRERPDEVSVVDSPSGIARSFGPSLT
jgi:hypothetical protein